MGCFSLFAWCFKWFVSLLLILILSYSRYNLQVYWRFRIWNCLFCCIMRDFRSDKEISGVRITCIVFLFIWLTISLFLSPDISAVGCSFFSWNVFYYTSYLFLLLFIRLFVFWRIFSRLWCYVLKIGFPQTPSKILIVFFSLDIFCCWFFLLFQCILFIGRIRRDSLIFPPISSN